MWAILASGQSLTEKDCETIRLAKTCGILSGVIAVSNVGIDRAPWADALYSHDISWWEAYPEAFQFEGRKFSFNGHKGTEIFSPRFCAAMNSGLCAMFLARDIFEAKSLILLGFDMHGTHYFGAHERAKRPGSKHFLTNTDEARFQKHIRQFDCFSGIPVVNCTEGSALKKFPFAKLGDVLHGN